jgi:hypothetical protein
VVYNIDARCNHEDDFDIHYCEVFKFTDLVNMLCYSRFTNRLPKRRITVKIMKMDKFQKNMIFFTELCVNIRVLQGRGKPVPLC